MINLNKRGVRIAKQMGDASTDPSISMHKGKIPISVGIPNDFTALAESFVKNGAASKIYEGKNDKFTILWDYKDEVLAIYEKKLVRKKEKYKVVDIEKFKKENKFEDGVNRKILASIATQLTLLSLENNGAIAQRGNISNELTTTFQSGIFQMKKVGEGEVISYLSVSDKNIQTTLKLTSEIFNNLSPDEKVSFLSKIKDTDQHNIIKWALKEGTLGELELGNYVPFTPKTVDVLLSDNIDTTTDSMSYSEHLQSIKDFKEESDLFSKATGVTKVGGQMFMYVPSIDETAVLDMNILPQHAMIDFYEGFHKESESLPLRREIKSLIKQAKENSAKLPLIKEKYTNAVNEVFPSFMDAHEIEKIKEQLENVKNLTNYSFLNGVFNSAILAEKVALKGDYNETYTLAVAKVDGRPLLSSSGIDFKQMEAINSSDNVAITISAKNSIKKKEMGDSPVIESIKSYSLSSILTGDDFSIMYSAKTIPEQLSYYIQDFEKMNEKGSIEYEVVNADGEKEILEKTVNLENAFIEIDEIIQQEGLKKSNKGISAALESLQIEMAKAQVSDNPIQGVKTILEDQRALHFPLIQSALNVSTKTININGTQSFIYSQNKASIKASVSNIHTAIMEDKPEEINYISFTAKQGRTTHSQQAKAMTGILYKIASMTNITKLANKILEREGKSSQRYIDYVDYCKKNSKTPSENTKQFSPKLSSMSGVSTTLQNKIHGEIVNYNRNMIISPDVTNFTKSVKVTKNGIEYDSEVPSDIEDIKSALEHAKTDYLTMMKASDVIPRLSASLKEKAQLSRNSVDVLNSIMGVEEKTEVQENQESIAPAAPASIEEIVQGGTQVQNENQEEHPSEFEDKEIETVNIDEANEAFPNEIRENKPSIINRALESYQENAESVEVEVDDIPDYDEAIFGMLEEEEEELDLFSDSLDSDDEDVEIRMSNK